MYVSKVHNITFSTLDLRPFDIVGPSATTVGCALLRKQNFGLYI